MKQETSINQPKVIQPEAGKNQITDSSQEQQINELKDLTRSLIQSVQVIQAQSARNTKFDDTMADLKATARAMLVNPQNLVVPGKQVPDKCGCKDEPCECTSSQCCCFDIMMTYVRVLSMQNLETKDSNLNPWAELEVKMFAYLDNGIGVVIPSLFSTLSLKKLVNHAGLKISINRIIGTVCLEKDKQKMITIGVDAIEEDSGLIERATGGRDEEGSNTGTMILDCCCSTQISTSFDIAFTSGGLGGGAIEVGFTAIKKP